MTTNRILAFLHDGKERARVELDTADVDVLLTMMVLSSAVLHGDAKEAKSFYHGARRSTTHRQWHVTLAKLAEAFAGDDAVTRIVNDWALKTRVGVDHTSTWDEDVDLEEEDPTHG